MWTVEALQRLRDLGPDVSWANRNPGGGGQASDTAVFAVRSGQPYLHWGNVEAYVVPLNDDMISYDPAKTTRLTDFREGLFMVERGTSSTTAPPSRAETARTVGPQSTG